MEYMKKKTTKNDAFNQISSGNKLAAIFTR